MADIPKDAPKPQVEPEAQNALTRKFTEAEWKAIKELQTALPLIIEEALPDVPDARLKVIDIWGVKIDPGRVDDARVSVILSKFLKATNLNVDEAIKRLTATIRWRESYKAAETANESFPKEVFGGVGYVFGKDKENRPITYNVYGGNKDLDAVFGDFDRFMRWRVSLMERGLQQIDFETVDSMIQIHDYEGVGLSSRTPASKKAAAEATKIFQEHYPELLHAKFFVNVPALMTWLFWLFKPLVSSQTFAKLKVVGSGPSTIGSELLPLVDATQLPKRYGGSAELA